MVRGKLAFYFFHIIIFIIINLNTVVGSKNAVSQISLKYFATAKIISTATICHKCLELIDSSSDTYKFTECEENNNNQFFKFSKFPKNNFLYGINSITNKDVFLYGSSRLSKDLLVFFVSEDGDAIISLIDEPKCLTVSTEEIDVYSSFTSCDLAADSYNANQLFKIYNKDYVQETFYVEGTLIDENNNNSVVNDMNSFLKNLYLVDVNNPNSYINLRLHDSTGNNSYFSGYLPRGTYDYTLDPSKCLYYKSLTPLTYTINTCFETLSDYKLNFKVSKFSDKPPKATFSYLNSSGSYLAKDELLSIQVHDKDADYRWIELDDTTFDPTGLDVDVEYFLAQPAKEDVIDYPIDCLYHTYNFKVYYNSSASASTSVYKSNQFLPPDPGVTSDSTSVSGKNDPFDLKDLSSISCSNTFNQISLSGYESGGKITYRMSYKCNKKSAIGSNSYDSNYTSGHCLDDKDKAGYSSDGNLQCKIDCLDATVGNCSIGYAMSYFSINDGNYNEDYDGDADYKVRNFNLYSGCKKTNGIAARFRRDKNNTGTVDMCIRNIDFSSDSREREAIENYWWKLDYTSKSNFPYRGKFGVAVAYVVLK